MTIEQIIVLAMVQGITEFLPISSSGHLILIPQLMHWPDQGQLTDVMTHLGTLLAMLIYFWRDVWHITRGALELFKGKVTDEGKLALYIVLATIPAVAFGFVLKKFELCRSRAQRHHRRLEHDPLRHSHADRRHGRSGRREPSRT